MARPKGLAWPKCPTCLRLGLEYQASGIVKCKFCNSEFSPEELSRYYGREIAAPTLRPTPRRRLPRRRVPRLERIEEEERLRARIREEERLRRVEEEERRREEKEQFRKEIEEAEAEREALKTVESLEKRISTRVSGKIYIIFGFVIAGILVLYFLGWNFILLTITLTGLIPAWIIFPSERDILKATPEGADIGGGHLILLTIKSGIKLAAIGLILYTLMPINVLITLILTFIIYFFLPVSYKTSQPHKFIESWVRLGFGFYLAILLYTTFSGTAISGSFLWLGLAFFFTIPKQRKEEEEGKSTVTISVVKSYEKYSENQLKWLDRFIFLFLIGAALFSFILPIGLNLGDPAQVTFLIIWFVSLISGLATGPQGRPFLGILMISVALFTFSTMYGAAIGRAVFGYWWPTVESFAETVITPLGEGVGTATSSLGDVWLMLTNPAEYYRRQMELTQVRTSRVMEGGTYKSIEIKSFDLSSMTPSILNPYVESLLGVIDLENQGEFVADDIKLSVDATWRPTNISISEDPLSVGTLKKITCSGQGENNIAAGTCSWSNVTYPGDIKEVTFIFDKDSWIGDGYDLGTCDPEPCTSDSVYKYANENVKINSQVNYSYNVNVSIPVEVINQNLYERLLIAGEIRLEQLESIYSGGPVKATIWTQKQPVRNGEESLVKVSIYNEGGGTLNFINYSIYVPPDLHENSIEVQTSTFSSCTSEGDYINCQYITSLPQYPPIKRGEYRMVTFYIKPQMGEVDIRTSSIIGLVNYDYSKTRSQSLTIANSPY